MEITLSHLKVQRTARFFTLGKNDADAQTIIFVLHGYGMAAAEFIRSFEVVAGNNTRVIAPEGLSRFYRKGYSGDVVASWMTKDDRLLEIDDYVNYLDSVYTACVNSNTARVIVIGFSQGVSTASRWLMRGTCRVDEFVLWCGEFAPDIKNYPEIKPRISQIIASDDEFIPPASLKEQTVRLEKLGFSVSEFQFEGSHAMDEPTLLAVLGSFK